ncbi:hypothetical protein [Subtercola lobariae]|uniref:Uncharacterized protein n=1 Tax=Subtercola lobariae TaxID=1588641 RepID=A0A917AYR1_9MICO|nr:hypothetical protein [Subtercola lobariae]GGF10524.1 hypothetical protein GCM10011399_00480 [Subtercola lobariae]
MTLVTAPIAATQYIEYLDESPTTVTPLGGRSWNSRAQNLTLVYSELADGDELAHVGEFEYVVLVTDDSSSVTVSATPNTVSLTGRGVIVVPPGESRVIASGPAKIVRLFDGRELTVVTAALNAGAYTQADARVAPVEPWPEPVGGRQLRVYPLADYAPEAGRFGNIFRTSTFMINFFDPHDGPRDAEQLSPHHHDDFEQCSLAVGGDWVHHIRTPWGPKRSQWRADEHRFVGSPSVAIIPPPVVHTSEAIGLGVNSLIDIFSPPRVDFSLKPGWVLNAADYPAPADLGADS